MSLDDRDWFAVYCRPRLELTAESHLKNQGFTTYLPRRVETRVRRSRRVEVTIPLFSCYLFVGVDPGAPLSLRPVHSTVGVLRVIGNPDGEPLVVPKRDMRLLLALAGEDGLFRVETQPFHFSRGDIVALKETSPFFGHLAEIESIDRAENVRILLRLFDRPTRATVPVTDVGEVVTRRQRRAARLGR